MKALVIGLGGIGQRHVRNLRSILGSSLELIAYRVRGLTHMVTPTLQLDTAKNIEQEYGITVFDNLANALAQKPDIALICNPSGLHVPVALACVEAGCDLFLEKPVSNNMDGVPELLSAVESRNRIVMVGYQLRFHPCVQTLTRLLASGKLGRVLAVRATVGEYLPNWHAYEDYRQMYASRADLGGGVILSQIHELDYLYSLFGLPRRVFSLGGHWSSLEIDVEDVASTLLECQVAGHSVAIHLHQDYVQRPPSRNCEVICDQGKVIADFAALRVTAYDHAGQNLEGHDFTGFDRNNLFMDQTQHFLECIEQRRQPVVNLHDGVQSLRMALAAKESIATGAPVTLHA